jgi:hypothetical protein
MPLAMFLNSIHARMHNPRAFRTEECGAYSRAGSSRRPRPRRWQDRHRRSQRRGDRLDTNPTQRGNKFGPP